MPAEVSAALAAAGERLRAANAERQATMDEIGSLVRAAGGEIPVTRLAQLTGLTRVTIYKMLDRPD